MDYNFDCVYGFESRHRPLIGGFFVKKFISILLVFAFFVLVFSFPVFAVAGDSSGDFSDFNQFAIGANGFLVPFDNSEYHNYQVYPISVNNQTLYTFLFNFPYEVSSGSVNFGLAASSGFIFPSGGRVSGQRVRFYSVDYSTLYDSTRVTTSLNNISVPAGSFFVSYTVYITPGSGYNPSLPESYYPDDIGYNNFVYSISEPPTDQEILDGVTAIAQSLLALETGPYYGVSGVTVDSNGDLQHTLTQNATLEDLLNALGIAGTDSNHVIRGIYNNFGSYFTLYSIDDSTSSTTQIYRGLPQYVNALGQSLTDGINRLQRDNNLLYNSISSLSSSQSALNTTLQDALYEETDSSPAENWSVAKWLKGIYDSISGFFTNFWSPAETDLKSAAEPGMQAAADNGLVASSSDVDSMNDIGNAFSSFASFPNVDPMDAVNILSDSDYYRFWTQETEDDLLRHDLLQSRGSKSFGSEVEYVDVLADHLKELHSILGVNVDGK